MNIAECLSDPALQYRLAENPYARDGLIDLSGPVIRLYNLSRDQFGQLLGKISTRRADEPASSCRRYPPNVKHSAEGEASDELASFTL